MNVEVDQSGKIGETNRKTSLAFSNGIGFTIVIPARVKRECIYWLKRRGRFKSRSYIEMFVAALFLLIKDHLDQIDMITIDIEYPGHDETIRGMLLNHIWKVEPGFPKENIRFAQIGKKSRAHEKAYRVFRGEAPPDRVIRTKELLAVLR